MIGSPGFGTRYDDHARTPGTAARRAVVESARCRRRNTGQRRITAVNAPGLVDVDAITRAAGDDVLGVHDPPRPADDAVLGRRP